MRSSAAVLIAPSNENRELGERFLNGNRSTQTNGWLWFGAVLLVLGVALFLLLRRRAQIAGIDSRPEPTIETPSFSFRGDAYQPSVEPDKTAVWSRARGTLARATRTQVTLASFIFPRLEDCVRDAAVRLLSTHQPWFDGVPKTARALAQELRVSAVRVPPDGKDLTLYARHAAFSGHIVEIGVSTKGSVTYVGLLG